jgi:hypothetical protein
MVKYDVYSRVTGGDYSPLVSSVMLQMPFAIDGTEYQTLEEFLNSLSTSSFEAFMSKLILEVKVRIMKQYAYTVTTAPPVLELWEVQARTDPNSTTDNATKSPNQLAESLGVTKVKRLGELKFVMSHLYDTTSVFNEHISYQGEISLKGDRENPNFFWSDDYLDEPNNRTYLYLTVVDGQQLIKAIDVMALGISFVDLMDVGNTII